MDTKAAKVEAVPKPTNKTELKRLDVNANSFEANGKQYLIHNSLSVERFKKFEELQIIAGFGYDYSGVFKQVEKAYNCLNAAKLADAGVTMHNLMTGAARGANKQEHPMLLILTLFVFTQDEDLRIWDETRAAEKVKDWNQELFDMRDFFQLAFRLSREFMADCRSDTQSILEGEAPTPETMNT